MMKQFLLLSAFLFLGASALVAQDKYGHLNFGNLISSLEETKAADSQLSDYQKQLVAKGEEMAKSWQEKAQKFAQKAQAGELAPAEQQKQQTALEEERGKILEYEQEVSQKVQLKRKELLEPIITKVEQAIEDVAKENGYVMIFDTSVFNAILFAEETDDVVDLVKAKL
jgi:outer membrane protein